MRFVLNSDRSSCSEELENIYCQMCFSFMHRDNELRRIEDAQKHYLSLAVRPPLIGFSIGWLIAWVVFLVKLPLRRTCSLAYKRDCLNSLAESAFRVNMNYRGVVDQLIRNYCAVEEFESSGYRSERSEKLLPGNPRFLRRGDLN